MKLVKKGHPHSSHEGRVPLYRALSKLGKASRNDASKLIRDGRVKVHGRIETNPNRMVNPDRAFIEIEGMRVTKEVPRILLMNKPVGYLTTKRDPEGRAVIYDLLPEEYQSFHPVGRLDQNTSGLLLLTNSSKISHFLTDPQNKIPRNYIALVRGKVTIEQVKSMKDGINEKGETLQFKEVRILKASQRESQLEIVLEEGKYREIRRMCLFFDHEVIKLKRIRFGDFKLDSLSSGAIQEVEMKSIEYGNLMSQLF